MQTKGKEDRRILRTTSQKKMTPQEMWRNFKAVRFGSQYGAWSWTWRPAAGQQGVHYVVMQATEQLVGQGEVLKDVGTFAVRVLPANSAPVITHGGCRILSK